MPDRRPPPDRLDAGPPTKNRPPNKSKPPKRPRARKTRATKDDSALLYWIAGGLVVLLLLLGAVYYETPEIKSWFASSGVTPENLLALTEKPENPAAATKEGLPAEKEKEKAAEETRLLVE